MRELVADNGRDETKLNFGYHMAYLSRDPLHDHAASKASEAPESELFGRTSSEMVDVLGKCAEAGLTHMELTTNWQSSAELIEVMGQFSAEVMPWVAD